MIKRIVVWTIIFGLLALSINLVFPAAISYVGTRPLQVGDRMIQVSYFDFWSYINNIKTTLDVDKLQLKLPTRTWRFNSSAWDIFDMLANNLALMLDYALFMINVVLYPIRLMGYVISIVCSLVGIDLTNTPVSLQWFKTLLDFFTGLQISYV